MPPPTPGRARGRATRRAAVLASHVTGAVAAPAAGPAAAPAAGEAAGPGPSCRAARGASRPLPLAGRVWEAGFAAAPRPAAAAAAAAAAVAAAGVQGEAPVERLCVVTGGSSGIGAAVCELFSRRGWRAVSVARRRCGVAGVESVEADLAKHAAVEEVAEAVRGKFCGARAQVCLVHGASNYPSDSAGSVDVLGLERALRLNVTVPALLTSRLLPLMAEGSSVLFVGSTLSEKAVGGKLSYCTAKHAMTGLMRAVAQDTLDSGVHTALICPGITDTPMVRDAVKGRRREAAFEAFVRDLQGQFLSPEAVASVVWDASQAPLLHGAVVHCNGGQRER